MSGRQAAHCRRGNQSGYAALFVALMATVLFALAAFSVDVGRWYLTGHQMQRAADAGALAGVVKLPGDPTAAFTTAKDFAKRNGFDDAAASTAVVTAVDGQPTRLRVTVTDTVQNVFGSLLGIPSTTLTRTAVADYAGPVAMGSPCNTFGNDPEAAGTTRAATCDAVNGQFWANVAGPASTKVSGDQFQAGVCAAGVDGCSGSTNSDYDPNGYFYTLHVKEAVSGLTVQLFDPALVDVGDLCDNAFIKGTTPALTTARNDWVAGNTETTVYAPDAGPTRKYCTGDVRFGGSGQVRTRFQVRGPSTTPWDPLTFLPLTGCSKTYKGFSGNLYDVVNQREADGSASPTYNSYVAENFRRWVSLCTIASVPAGDYLIQVNTNGLGADAAAGHNRFAMRAFSATDSAVKDKVSISARGKMAIYANMTGSRTEFYLARVPRGAAGQVLNVTLFDAGDSSIPGTITLKAPPDSGVTFTNCKASGVVNATLPSCQVTANGTFNGKKQVISVVIPDGYSCNSALDSACWVRLEYDYGSGSVPTDTTSWQANIEGDPVRLVE